MLKSLDVEEQLLSPCSRVGPKREISLRMRLVRQTDSISVAVFIEDCSRAIECAQADFRLSASIARGRGGALEKVSSTCRDFGNSESGATAIFVLLADTDASSTEPSPNDNYVLIRCDAKIEVKFAITTFKDDFAYFLAHGGHFADARIVVEKEDVSFDVHKAILAARSSAFENIFTIDEDDEPDVTEGETSNVCIVDLPVRAVRVLLKYIYTDSVDDLDGVLHSSFVAADMFDVQGLRDVCEMNLIRQLKEDNLFEEIVFASRNDARLLRRKGASLFRKFLQSDEWHEHAERVPRVDRENLDILREVLEGVDCTSRLCEFENCPIRVLESLVSDQTD